MVSGTELSIAIADLVVSGTELSTAIADLVVSGTELYCNSRPCG